MHCAASGVDDRYVGAVPGLPRRNSRAAAHLIDPLVLLLEMADGALVDVEVSVNIGYGYDIHCEVVGESGTAALADPAAVIVRRAGWSGRPVPVDWRERFLWAYDTELQDWVDHVAAGTSTGPSAWDGYAATVVADGCLESLRTGERVPISLGDKPSLYQGSAVTA
jgi:myo-inositol 2-dehydrogenase/D-chiro-inositol 1-dehydrogenase